MTSREAAAIALGEQAVANYERVKRFYTRYGLALERAFADAVDGRVGRVGEPDVTTRLGAFEFMAQANTKNSAGDRADRDRVGVGHVVQVAGVPRRGRISAVEFLRLHGYTPFEAARMAARCELAAMNEALDDATLF